MYYKEFKPSGFLSDYIKCIWIMEKKYSEVEEYSEVIWPDLRIELLFTFFNNYKIYPSNTSLPSSFIIGPLKEKIYLKSSGKFSLIGVRFKLHGLYPFLKIKPKDIMNGIWFLKDDIVLKNLNPTNIESSIEYLEEYLEGIFSGKLSDSQYDSRKLIDKFKNYVKNNCEKEIKVNIEEFCSENYLSTRQLERIFKEVIGYSPKSLDKIIKFNNMRYFLFKHPDKNILDLSNEFLYYDYSHLVKDFKRYIGMTPREFVKIYSY